MPFGAFVDIGGIDGLVHISDLTYDRVGFGEKAVSKFVQEGQRVTVRILKLDGENKRISLGLKQTQSDPFATAVNAITEGAEVTGKVTKVMEFGAFIELGPGVEGLVHISELAERHVEIPEQVVQVGTDIFVKVIDIDLDRRRISLSLKQANEGQVETVEFDPTLYDMSASYDDKGEYVYPEGFDPETGEWREGFDKQREEWERQYAEAQIRFEAHKKQMDEAKKADQAAALETGETPSTYSSESGSEPQAQEPEADDAAGSLASDQALAALREKLTGSPEE
jgi:small subunit ribosomal protein S1